MHLGKVLLCFTLSSIAILNLLGKIIHGDIDEAINLFV